MEGGLSYFQTPEEGFDQISNFNLFLITLIIGYFICKYTVFGYIYAM